MRLHVEILRGWVSPTNAFIALYSENQNSFWLDREHQNSNRFSVIGSGNPVGVKKLSDLEGQFETYTDHDLPFDFRPGLVGLVDFESHNPQFLRVDSALVFDHDNHHIYLMARTDTEQKFRRWLDAALLRIGLIGGESLKYLAEVGEPHVTEVRARHSDDAYLTLIEQAQHYISQGDVYQICLTNEYEIHGTADPLSTFIALRSVNLAPYSGYLKLGGVTLVSSSPEQFIRVSPTGRVSTKPIKGTRRRGFSSEEDAEIIDELQNDVKERAENLMIVDLMRNDLSKVCEVESVTVEKLFDVETYSTVHQLVSTVTGQLEAGNTAIDAINAAFPGGSMTGAPKIRAVELIEELESGNRGVYSGIFGYLGDNGSADFGMVIRSLVFEANRITLGVGGGITIDSDPQAELRETKLKAKALLRALKAPDLLG